MKYFKLRFLFSKLIHLGTDKVDPNDRIYIKQTNCNGLFFFFLDMILALTFWYILDEIHLSIGLITSGFLFLISSLGFNYLGLTTISRLSTASIGSLLVAYCAFYLGPDSFTAASLMLGAIFPFVYFSIRDKFKIIICLLIPFTIYIILILTDYTLGPRIENYTESGLLTLKLIMFIIPYLGILANSWLAVSERERKNDEVLESKQLIETIFFALTHDLANPMQNIAFLARYNTKSTDFTETKIKSLQTNASHLMRIFNNLKDIVKYSIDSKVHLAKEKYNLLDLIHECRLFIEEQLKNKNITLIIKETPKIQQIYISVDKEIFIFQIMANFITNAIKFSNPGSQVEISFQDANNYVLIAIRDWGCGIEKDKIRKLFDWKERTSTLGTRGEKGSGLGLPLAHKFTQELGGSVEIQSFPEAQYNPNERGTIITLKFPKA